MRFGQLRLNKVKMYQIRKGEPIVIRNSKIVNQKLLLHHLAGPAHRAFLNRDVV